MHVSLAQASPTTNNKNTWGTLSQGADAAPTCAANNKTSCCTNSRRSSYSWNPHNKGVVVSLDNLILLHPQQLGA